MSDDDPAAALCGIHAARTQFPAFTLAADAAGVAGALLAWATGIHSQCIGLQAGGEANLMVATRSVADSGP
ncbi:hypothetical protein ACFYPQ_42155, partial [Streptomyces sp. NPDC005522]